MHGAHNYWGPDKITTGTPRNGEWGAQAPHFGITAEEIGEFKIGRARVDRTPVDGEAIGLAPDFTAVDLP
ncbi:MAG: hypothetical protein ABI680_19735 [Chthoniobacteraceae bacterium]